MLQHAFRRRSAARCLQMSRYEVKATNPIYVCARINGHQPNNGFSSQASIDADAEAKHNRSNKNRVPKTLYRQLLSWCRKNDNIPFSPLPPLTLSPPQVNSHALKRLMDMRTFLNINDNEIKDVVAAEGHDVSIHHPAYYAMYDDNIVVKENMITFPEIKDANQLRSIIRSVYWLNNENTIASIDGMNNLTSDDKGVGTQEQITLAFDAIKSCNQLSSSDIDPRLEKRKRSIQLREGGNEDKEHNITVEYHVGQVVKHKKKKWRGVIAGWDIKKDKKDSDGNGRVGSLTTKQYSFLGNKEGDSALVENDAEPQDDAPSSKVQYTILVDLHDAQSSSDIYSSDDSPILTVTLEDQVHLSPVDDPW